MRTWIFLLACAAGGLLPQAATADVTITTGPILGRLSSNGIGVWARTKHAGSFKVRYGQEADRLDRATHAVETTVAHDNTGWVHITGLSPDTKYYYELTDADGNQVKGAKGSFRTLPDARLYRNAEVNPQGLFNFSFEYACGNNQNPGQGSGPDLPAFGTMLRELKDRVHFSILNGDWLYETKREYPVQQWLKQVGITAEQEPQIVKVAPTIVGVWENYKFYLRTGKNLAAYHRNMPTFFTFDDHEILNDVWGAGSPGLRDRRAVFRDIGVQAWYDYLGWSNPTHFQQPIHFGQAKLAAGSDILTDPAAKFTRLDPSQAGTLLVHWGGPTAGVNDNALDGVGGDPNAGVYAVAKVLDDHRLRISPPAKEASEVSYSIGRRSYYRMQVSNCDFFVLDTRTHREMHDTREPGKKGISMLGQQQKKWLLDGVRHSKADFIFVVSSVNFMVPHIGGGTVRANNKDDAWTVFFDEREQLIDAFDKLGKPVLILTGDLHNSFVIKITDRVWECASGPHNSSNHWSSDEGNRPATGRFKYGPRECDIRWSTYYRNDIPRSQLRHPTYCFNNPQQIGDTRWVAFERPQVIFQYFDGRTGELKYAESITAADP